MKRHYKIGRVYVHLTLRFVPSVPDWIEEEWEENPPLLEAHWTYAYFCPDRDEHWWNGICGIDVEFHKWRLWIDWGYWE